MSRFLKFNPLNQETIKTIAPEIKQRNEINKLAILMSYDKTKHSVDNNIYIYIYIYIYI